MSRYSADDDYTIDDESERVDRLWPGSPLTRMSNPRLPAASRIPLGRFDERTPHYLVNVDADPDEEDFATQVLTAVATSPPLPTLFHDGSDASDDDSSGFSPHGGMRALEEFISDPADFAFFDSLPFSQHYTRFQLSAGEPALLVKRLPIDATELDVVTFLVKHGNDYDNPVPELLRVVERVKDAYIVVEDKPALEAMQMAAHERVAFARQMLRYLAFLHSNNIGCINLNPSNIIVSPSPFGDIYELVDYASAMRFPIAARRSLSVANIPRDNSPAPELWCKFGTVDPFQIDVWALGRTLDAVGMDETPLQPLVETMMAQDPNRRPTSSAALDMFFAMTGE